MSFCPGCFQPNVELAKTRDEAKKAANATGVSMAICKEGDGYRFVSALYACQNGFAIVEIIVATQ